jgi:hypothetical protein
MNVVSYIKPHVAAALVGLAVWIGAVVYYAMHSTKSYSQLSERGFCDAREVPGTTQKGQVEEVYFVGCGGFF